jgi:TonB family protein
MRRIIPAAGIGLALAGALSGAAARAQPAADVPPGVSDPEWLAEPSFEDRAKAYPPAALAKGLSGRTTLRCKVNADGALADCALASETPAGMGFGAASLALAGKFHLKPESVASAPAEMTIPIRWVIASSPDWQRMPDTDGMMRLYPKAALDANVSGKTMAECRVKADGTLSDCFVAFEAPQGFGFGRAALAATKYFRMKPMMLDGQAVDGALVRVPINWFTDGGAINFAVGDNAVLITVLKHGAATDSRVVDFACPSAEDRARKCQARPVRWLSQPANTDAFAIIMANNLNTGETRLSCAVGEDGSLTDCVVSGQASAEEEAAMRVLASSLRAAPRTSDGVSVRLGRIVVPFDWAQLSFVTQPGASRAVAGRPSGPR